jgi:hypothetical protein
MDFVTVISIFTYLIVIGLALFVGWIVWDKAIKGNP